MQTIAGMETEATGNAGTGRLSRTPDRLSTSFPHTRISPYPQRPIIKSTIDQRDASGVTLEDITVSGVTFTEIIALLFEQLSARIKGRAVQTDDGWSLLPVIMVDWAKMMQFRFERHGVETTKAEEAWNQWVKSTRRQTIHLLVYECGLVITKPRTCRSSRNCAFNHLKPTDRAQPSYGACGTTTLPET
ncbi:hypothetical protein JG688_00002149 [Phytophthora aleatoria]|uniref:Uncharacterized protein n=1 Tax=Phytophthora aleatoria TaxID=2496075 RepID=A0A8J5JFL5_9STRA|nr:hypothetical protein JG688_00002149 [Phytophthora aleatoria]